MFKWFWTIFSLGAPVLSKRLRSSVPVVWVAVHGDRPGSASYNHPYHLKVIWNDRNHPDDPDDHERDQA